MAIQKISTGTLGNDSVTAAQIAPGTIVDSDLGDNAVTTAKILNANVTTAKIADDAVTLAKMAPGTDGNIISYDASGNPVAVATGTAGQLLTSAGAGAPPTFTTVASTPENLVKSFTLTSGKTVTLGKMVSLASSGEVGTLPSVNTLGTYRATTNTHQYGGENSRDDSAGGISWNGTRGISFSGTASNNAALRGYSGSQGSRVVTCSGHVFSTSATTVDGSTTVTIPIPNSIGPTSQDGYTSYFPAHGGWNVFSYPLTDTSFMVISLSGSSNNTASPTSWRCDWSATVVTVDSSGNCTKGTTATDSRTSSAGGTPSSLGISSDQVRRLANNTFITNYGWGDTYNNNMESDYQLKRVIKWTGGTGAQINKSNYAQSLSEVNKDHLNGGSVRTSGNKIVWNNPAPGTKMVSIADSDGGLGNTASVTSVLRDSIPVVSPGIAMVGDQYDGGFRLPLDETKLYWSGYNYTGTNTRVIIGATISAAGVATLDVGTYDTGNTDAARVDNPEFGTIQGAADGTLAMAGFRTIGGKLFMNTFALNSTGRVLLGNLGLEVTGALTQAANTIRWTGSKWLIFTRESNSLSANQVTVDLTVGSQSTLPINFIGFPTATDSSSPASIVVQGVASGFSSLTPGQTYFENNLHDGTVVLDNTSGVKVGKAISSTEMLLNRTL